MTLWSALCLLMAWHIEVAGYFDGFMQKKCYSITNTIEFCLIYINSLRLGDAYIHLYSNHHSENGLSPGRHQAIIWTNDGILLIGPLETNFSEILIEIYTFSFKKMYLKMLSGNRWPFCLSLNVLSHRFEGPGMTHIVSCICQWHLQGYL